MKPNALIKACDSARKSKLPVFFEDRFFDRSVESRIDIGIISNPKGWRMPAGQHFPQIPKEFSDFSFQMKYPNC